MTICERVQRRLTKHRNQIVLEFFLDIFIIIISSISIGIDCFTILSTAFVSHSITLALSFCILLSIFIFLHVSHFYTINNQNESRPRKINSPITCDWTNNGERNVRVTIVIHFCFSFDFFEISWNT